MSRDHNNIKSQLDATVIILLIFSISSTCFVRQFRLSSGALDCVYSLWYKSPTMLPAGGQDEVELLIYYASKFTSLCYGKMEYIPFKKP